MPRIVTAAIVIRDGRVLLARRAGGQAHAGCWEFPGGKLEPGETEEACLAREMLEELGMVGSAGKRLAESAYAYEKGEILLRAYLFAWRSGEMRLTVHDRVRWAAPRELEGVAFTPADLPIARAAAEYMEGIEHV